MRLLGIADQTEPFGAVEVVDEGGDALSVRDQIGRQGFVAQRILQAPEAGDERIDAFGEVGIRFQLQRPGGGKGFGKEALVGEEKMGELALGQL